MQGKVVRVVIADDHEIFREGVKLTLSKLPDVVTLGEASNGLQLIELVNRYNPDVVITDIKMPQMDGIEAVRKIKSKHPETGIIALSMFDRSWS
jgi:DNA-binding NarL/FixJ family response regulator